MNPETEHSIIHIPNNDISQGHFENLNTVSITDVLHFFKHLRPTAVADIILRTEPKDAASALASAFVNKIRKEWLEQSYHEHYQDSLTALAMLGEISTLSEIVDNNDISNEVTVRALIVSEHEDAHCWLREFIGTKDNKVKQILAEALRKLNMIDELFALTKDDDKYVADAAIREVGKLTPKGEVSIVAFIKTRFEQELDFYENQAKAINRVWTQAENVSGAHEQQVEDVEGEMLTKMPGDDGCYDIDEKLPYRRGGYDANTGEKKKKGRRLSPEMLQRQKEAQQEKDMEVCATYEAAAKYQLEKTGSDKVRAHTDDERELHINNRAMLIRAMAAHNMFEEILAHSAEWRKEIGYQIAIALGKPLISFLEQNPENAQELRERAVSYLQSKVEQTGGTRSVKTMSAYSLKEHGEIEILGNLVNSEDWEIAQIGFEALIDQGAVEHAARAAQDYFRKMKGLPAFTVISDLFVKLGDPRYLVDVIEKDKNYEVQSSGCDIYLSYYFKVLTKFPEHRAYVLEKLAPYQEHERPKVRSGLVEAYAAMDCWEEVMLMSHDLEEVVISKIARCIQADEKMDNQRKQVLLKELRNNAFIEYYSPYQLNNLNAWFARAAASTLPAQDGKIYLPADIDYQKLLEH